MNKYTLRRTLKRVERCDIEAETWGEAVDKLNAFQNKPFPKDEFLTDDLTIEFTGEAE